ncbi:hypothetical protein [Lysobacter sp. HA35]
MATFLRLALLLLTFAPSAVLAAEPPVGTYHALGGHGDMEISKTPHGTRFVISSMGVNGHSCDLDGSVHNDTGVVPKDGDSGECRIAFKPVAGGYAVEALTPDECRQWCGARGRFDYTYGRRPATCADKTYRAEHDRFYGLYKAKRYGEALPVAIKLRDTCGPFQWFPDKDALTNDIAVTLYHLQQPGKCLAELRTTMAWACRTVEDARNSLPPFEADSYETVAKSTLTNRKLCEAAR